MRAGQLVFNTSYKHPNSNENMEINKITMAMITRVTV